MPLIASASVNVNSRLFSGSSSTLSSGKTIKDDQLINPIFVYRFGTKCRLIAGERRTLATAIAGKNEIIARIASQRPVGTKLRVLQWIENNERSDLSLAERVASIEAIIKEYHAENSTKREKVTAELLGELTGMSTTQAWRYMSILGSEPEIKKAVLEGKLENIKLVKLICSVKNPEKQKELLNAAISGQQFEAISKLKKELEAGDTKKKRNMVKEKNSVNLGRVKPNVVKLIIDALVSSKVLKGETVKKINNINESSQWSNTDTIEKGFKKIMALLDEQGV